MQNINTLAQFTNAVAALADNAEYLFAALVEVATLAEITDNAQYQLLCNNIAADLYCNTFNLNVQTIQSFNIQNIAQFITQFVDSDY